MGNLRAWGPAPCTSQRGDWGHSGPALPLTHVRTLPLATLGTVDAPNATLWRRPGSAPGWPAGRRGWAVAGNRPALIPVYNCQSPGLGPTPHLSPIRSSGRAPGEVFLLGNLSLINFFSWKETGRSRGSAAVHSFIH